MNQLDPDKVNPYRNGARKWNWALIVVMLGLLGLLLLKVQQETDILRGRTARFDKIEREVRDLKTGEDARTKAEEQHAQDVEKWRPLHP